MKFDHELNAPDAASRTGSGRNLQQSSLLELHEYEALVAGFALTLSDSPPRAFKRIGGCNRPSLFGVFAAKSFDALGAAKGVMVDPSGRVPLARGGAEL